MVRVRLGNACFVAGLAAAALVTAQETALARGGHSHGHLHRAIQIADPPTPGAAVQQISPSAVAATAGPVKANPVLPAPPPAPAPTPASAIGTPAPQLQPLAPLSPAVTTTFLTAGGTARTDTAASPSSSSSSPSEAAPGLAGGGGKSLADCMGFWDRDTHMTKAEWRGACVRSLNRLANLKPEILGLTQSRH